MSAVRYSFSFLSLNILVVGDSGSGSDSDEGGDGGDEEEERGRGGWKEEVRTELVHLHSSTSLKRTERVQFSIFLNLRQLAYRTVPLPIARMSMDWWMAFASPLNLPIARCRCPLHAC